LTSSPLLPSRTSGQVVHLLAQRLGDVGQVEDDGRVVADAGRPQRRQRFLDALVEVALAVEVGLEAVAACREGCAARGDLAGDLADDGPPGADESDHAVAQEFFLGLGQIAVDSLKELVEVGR